MRSNNILKERRQLTVFSVSIEQCDALYLQLLPRDPISSVGAGSSGREEGCVETSAFQLSRIYSQGWNAARQLLAAGKSDLDAKDAAARNPYPPGQERTRWMKGFLEALRSRAGSFTPPTGNSWRPAVQRSPADKKAPRSTTGGSSSA